MKRIVSLVLAVSMVLSMFTFSFASSSLTDVAGTEYEAAVEALIELGVVEGYPDKTYKPSRTVSRAEMAKMLVVAAGLNDAAAIAEGATRFSDVNGGWASGYVNVAAEYGYIAGYPDGTFQPDKQVSYAEATTMALRVLGYKTVVESKGTWPTNYIAKAHDLQLLDEITYGTYNDGAVRGNVAKLIWNMLRTEMWDVTAESEGDGLVSQKDRLMLNVKFPDYSYGKVAFDSFEIDKDGKVMVTLDDLGVKKEYPLEAYEYEYVGNDFYKFVKTQEVEVLVNEEDETLLTMVSTGADKVVEGLKADIDEDYDAISGDKYDYAYALIERRDVEESTQLKIESEYIYEVDEAKNGKSVKFNKMSKMTYEDFDDEEVVIIDGQRGSIKDVEVGDVFSKVTVNGEVFYIVESSTEEGKLTKLVEADGDKLPEITVAGEKYPVDSKATYVIDPEDEDEDQDKVLLTATKDHEDMKNEEVVMYLDFVGRVVRVEFDGNIDGEDDSEWKFFTVAEVTDRKTSREYIVKLANEDGDEEYAFAKAADGKDWFNKDASEHAAGDFVLVEFDDDGEILSMTNITRVVGEDEYEFEAEESYLYGEEADDEAYIVLNTTKASYDDDKEEILDSADKRVVDVDDDLVVVFLVWDDKGTDTTKDDEVVVRYEEGLDAIDDLKDEDIVVVYDDANKIKTAKYIVRFDDASTRVDDLADKLTDVSDNLVDGKYFEITVDDVVDTTLRIEKADADKLEDVINGVIVYSTKTNKDDEEVVTVKSVASVDDLLGLEDAPAVEAVLISTKGGAKVKFDNSDETYTLDQLVDELYKGYLFVVVDVNVEPEDDEDVVGSVTAVADEALTSSTFRVDDRLLDDTDGKVVYIVRGYDEKEKVETPVEPEEPTNEEVVEELATAATEFTYDDSYEYTATMVVSGDTVTVTCDDFEADKDGVSTFSADTARFLGGLYRAGNVEKITYDGNDYTWITEPTELKGSNWRQEAGTTLVSVLRTAQKGGATTFELTLDDTNTLNYVIGE